MANKNMKTSEKTQDKKTNVEVDQNVTGKQGDAEVKQDESTVDPSSDPAMAHIELTQDEFTKVKTHIESLQKEKEEAIALAQRLQADFDNYRKRNATLRTDSYEEGRRDCMKALLPVIDNFDRALESTEGVQEGFVEGIRLVRRMLLDTLEQFGLREIETECPFDPNLHDAVLQEPVEGRECGEILDVLQKGYLANDKVLRYSAVKVVG